MLRGRETRARCRSARDVQALILIGTRAVTLEGHGGYGDEGDESNNLHYVDTWLIPAVLTQPDAHAANR